MELAASESPERPAGLPEGGAWNATLGKWEAVSRRGADGEREGECLRFRADGTLFSRSRFVAGVEEGPFTVYHPDGTVAREGQYVGGRVDGVVRVHASPDGSGEPLRSCCVPPGATRMEIRYRSGDYLQEVFYDHEGRALLSDGTLRPPRPEALPDLVEFEESRGGWIARSPTLDRFWTLEGRLVEEEERPGDGRRVTRGFDPDGRVREERGVDAEGRRAGPYYCRFDAAANPYADPRIRGERGAFDAGQVVGAWTFLDETGAVVRTVDRGIAAPATLAETSPAFAPALGDGWALARELIGQSRVREALCAAARAAARAGESQRDTLAAFIREHVVALTPAVELERGEELTHSLDLDVPGALNALLCGAEAAFVFRSLGAVIPGAGAAVVDLVDASFLLAPGRASTHITRALVRAQRGDEPGARADVRVVAADAPDASVSLTSYLDVVFRPFEPPALWNELVAEPEPAAELDPDSEPATVVGQSLEAIQQLAAVYATRLARLRAAVLAWDVERKAGETSAGAPSSLSPSLSPWLPPWLPPELPALLPDGPVELHRETVACDPNPDGGEPETIEIDEQLSLDGLTVPGLLTLAHADHAALAWLCWSTGLGRIDLPRAIEPPATLIAGMRAIVHRHWRAHDRGKMGGLMALAKGVPGFEWQGIAVDEMPPHVLSIALAELLAVRSMFLWLLSPDAMSPFQDDIRDA